ncbi:MAG: hypothetical protein LBF92_07315, partial [Synergistaceae bacterium]|nr:hypothetical protein [Synergistaceae bacterium]
MSNNRRCAENCCRVGNNNIASAPTSLRARDYLGAFKARFGIGRMNYKIDPGLYAVGNPDKVSSVLVSANYKLTFDTLR